MHLKFQRTAFYLMLYSIWSCLEVSAVTPKIIAEHFSKRYWRKGVTLWLVKKLHPFKKCCQNITLHDIKIFKSYAGHSEDGTKLNPIIIHDTALKSSQKWTHFTHVIYSQYLKCFVFYNVWTPGYSPRLAQQEGGSWFGLGLFQ